MHFFFFFLSTLETTFDTNVTTEISGRSILSLTARPTPLSWRLGQSSPRLQAGDAPSMGNGYPPRGNASRFINTESGRYMYSAPLRRQLASRGSSVCHVDISDKGSDEIDLEGITMDATGYMSDGDVLGKNIRADDITSGSVPLLFFLNTLLYVVLALCLMTLYSGDYLEKEKKKKKPQRYSTGFNKHLKGRLLHSYHS